MTPRKGEGGGGVVSRDKTFITKYESRLELVRGRAAEREGVEPKILLGMPGVWTFHGTTQINLSTQMERDTS